MWLLHLFKPLWKVDCCLENTLNLVRVFTCTKLKVVSNILLKVTLKRRKPYGYYNWLICMGKDMCVVYSFLLHLIRILIYPNGNFGLSHLPFPERSVMNRNSGENVRIKNWGGKYLHFRHVSIFRYSLITAKQCKNWHRTDIFSLIHWLLPFS